MTEPENIILKHLSGLRASVDRLADEVHDAKLRLTDVEMSVSAMRRDLSHYDAVDARQ